MSLPRGSPLSMSISVVLISVIIYFVGKFPALSQTLAENTIVQALLVSTLGGLLYIAINFMSDTIERQTMSKFWRSVTISNRDPSYAAVLEFVTKHSTQAMVSTNVVTKKRKGDWAQWRKPTLDAWVKFQNPQRDPHGPKGIRHRSRVRVVCAPTSTAVLLSLKLSSVSGSFRATTKFSTWKLRRT